VGIFRGGRLTSCFQVLSTLSTGLNNPPDMIVYPHQVDAPLPGLAIVFAVEPSVINTFSLACMPPEMLSKGYLDVICKVTDGTTVQTDGIVIRDKEVSCSFKCHVDATWGDLHTPINVILFDCNRMLSRCLFYSIFINRLDRCLSSLLLSSLVFFFSCFLLLFDCRSFQL
jgi:hypothetical protein